MKLVHDIWWTLFCQEPKLFLKYNKVCQVWNDWDMNTKKIKKIWTHQEKHWIWKHVCWIGNINQIQNWEDLDVTHLNINNWYYYHSTFRSKWNYGLVKACHGGNRELADYMIEKGANYWGGGLYGVCRGGKRELVDYVIEKGADYWDGGLIGACHGGNRELVDYMIEKGANDWNWGLEGACRGGKRELADYMIEKGATNGYLIDKYFPS